MLLKKLRVKPELPLVIIGLPKNCAALFDDGEYKTAAPRSGNIEQLIFFAKDAETLREKFVPLVTRLSPDALVWVMYPKKSGSITSDLSMHEGWKPAFDTGLTGVASAAINDDWSGFRLRSEKLVKGALAPVEVRSNENIDYVKRTVVLPDDATRAVKKHAGMFEFFHGLAFTHRKEHVVAILDAKKTETRERRITKMIEMLAEQMKASAKKKAR
ncbi:MAG: YdeI/OmpD-associated family protein [Gemmatimonadaceae bacterium]